MACTDSADDDPDLTDPLVEPRDLFVADELLDIEIEMTEDDWTSLRWEGRAMPRVYAGCFEFPGYTYFNSTVTIGGERVENVPVRKKGFLGSLSTTRPSLKMNFGRGEAYQDRTFHSEKRFTLNNNKQDRSNVKQCLSYALFRQSGIKAPLCNFAHISLRGEDLGIYSHVEAIKKAFLERAFGDDSGNLYEGQVSDFNSGLASTFQLKTNERENDRSDIEAVIAALQTDDDKVWDALDEVIDMDEFLTFWAMEVLVGHWDSYSGNQNNFYFYHDPTDDRFHFIPWGTDGSFASEHSRLRELAPKSIYAASEITSRLGSIPQIRTRYETRLRELMDELWDEEALIAEVDRMGELTRTPAAQLSHIKKFIGERRAVIEAELEGTALEWPREPRAVEIECVEPPATSGTFELAWTDTNSFTPGGSFTFNIPIAGQPIRITTGFISAAGPVQETDDAMAGTPRIAFIGRDDTTGRIVLVGLYVPESMWTPGEIRFHGWEIFGIVVEILAENSYKRLGMIGAGSVTLERAGRTDGATVKGSWQGQVATDFENGEF